MTRAIIAVTRVTVWERKLPASHSTFAAYYGIFVSMEYPSDGISAADLIRANELIAHADYKGAVALLERLVADDPTESAALTALGIAFTEGGEHHKAVKALVRSLQLKEDDAEAHEALGCAYFRLGELGTAKRHLERARELVPEDGGVLRNLGVVIDRLGDFDGGSRLIERACELNRWDYQAIYALASVRLRQGEIEAALELLERIAAEDSPAELKVLALDHVHNLKRYLKT